MEDETCDLCGGPVGVLGVLGRLEHLQCRNCGANFSRPLPPTVADTILDQMGGSRRLGLMIGANSFLGDEKSVRFRFKTRAKNGSNMFRVTLDPSDTYTIEFISVRGASVKVKDKLEDVYAEDLVRIFQEKTGLYLSL